MDELIKRSEKTLHKTPGVSRYKKNAARILAQQPNSKVAPAWTGSEIFHTACNATPKHPHRMAIWGKSPRFLILPTWLNSYPWSCGGQEYRTPLKCVPKLNYRGTAEKEMEQIERMLITMVEQVSPTNKSADPMIRIEWQSD